jgi:cytoskeletal protein CcmA (bactofilin family)
VKTKSTPQKNGGRRKGKRKRAREKKLRGEEAADSIEDRPPAKEPGPPASVAEVFGLTQADSGEEVQPSKEEKPVEEDYQLGEDTITLGNEAASYEELTEGSMAALIGDLVEHEEKREQARAAKAARPEKTETDSEKPEPKPAQKPEPAVLAEKEKPVISKKEVSKNQIRVRCFRCNHCQWESKHAESTQCGRCNTYISLADYQIRQPSDRVIRTRGNVTVHRRGALLGSELACRNLLAMGTISTRIDCSGEARFKYSATVNGNLFCETLIVEKGTIVEFTEGVYSESVKIYGTLRGDVICAGLVEVMRSGILDGDVVAREIDLQDGGTLTGEMEIDPELKVKLPAVKGYDPSIID